MENIKNTLRWNFSVPPGDPIMLDKMGRQIDLALIGPFDEGSSLTLTCKSNGGKKIWFGGNMNY